MGFACGLGVGVEVFVGLVLLYWVFSVWGWE